MSRQEKLAALASTGVTKAELDNIDGGTARGTTAIADGDGVLINDAGTMRMTSVETMATYMGTKIGGGMEFIASTDISDAATVSFTGFDASKYDNYVFYIQNVTITGNGGIDFGLRTSSNGGSSYDSGSSDYQWLVRGQRGTTDEDSYDAADTDIRLTLSQGGDTGEEGGASGTVEIFGPHLTTKTRVTSSLGYFHSGSNGDPAMHLIYGVRDSEADVDAVQFFMSSGNIASGTITMYGLVNS